MNHSRPSAHIREGNRDSAAVMIGDSPTTDVAGGRLAGLATILVSPEPQRMSAPETTADFVVPELADVVREQADQR